MQRFYRRVLDAIEDGSLDLSKCGHNGPRRKDKATLSSKEYYANRMREVIDNPQRHNRLRATVNQIADRLHCDISELVPPEVITAEQFIFFGCPESPELNVMIFIDGKEDVQLFKRGLLNINIDKIEEKMDFSLRGKPLDPTVVVHNPVAGDLSMCSKGSKVYQNFAINTMHLYPQACESPLKNETSRYLSEYVRDVSAWVFDNQIELIGDVAERFEVFSAYKKCSRDVRRLYSVTGIGDLLDLTSPELSMMVRRIVQAMICANGDDMVYTRSELYDYLVSKKPGMRKEVWRYLIYLDDLPKELNYDMVRRGVYILLEQYEKLIDDMQSEFNWHTGNLNVGENKTTLPDEMFREFVTSPFSCSDKFRDMLVASGKTVNKLLPFPNFGLDSIPDFVRGHIIPVDRNTPDWRKLGDYYKCRIPPEVPDGIDTFYVCRGAIMEQVVVAQPKFEHMLQKKVRFARVGMLVAEPGTRGSVGVTPDLLAITEDAEVLPVEIKTVCGEFGVSPNYRRALNLMRRDIALALDIIGKGTRGIVIIANIDTTRPDLTRFRACYCLVHHKR